MRTYATERVEELLDEWQELLRFRKIERARTLKQKMDDIAFTNPHLIIEYKLIACQHAALTEDYDQVDKLLDELAADEDFFTNKQRFYYYFFKGRSAYHAKNDHLAKEYYDKAQQYLNEIDSELDQAEFYYKQGQLNYGFRRSFQANHCASQALKIFKKYHLDRRVADCYNLLGLSCLDLQLYEDAETYLHMALDYAKKLNIQSIRAYAAHNVGLLYSDQNLSTQAITWLNEAVKMGDINYVTAYLLALEYFKTNDVSKAEKWLYEGLKLCKSANNEVYPMRFELLRALFLDKENFEKVYRKGIAFFRNRKDWDFVRDYSRELADFYYSKQEYEKAADYYRLSFSASDKIKEMGALH